MNITKTLLLSGIMIFSVSAFSQNTLPNSGNVGIGTTSPSSDLEVMGETKVEKLVARDTAVFEKPVKIKDSLYVESKMIVDQDVKIKGQTVFVGDAKVKSDINILGTTKMKGDAFVEGDFKFKGLEDINTTDERFLMLKPNGKAVSMEKGGLINLIYEPKDCTKDGTTYPAPIWTSVAGTNSPGVLYTADQCPGNVGIGTSTPQANLQVSGTTFLTGNTGIGIAPSVDARLSIKQTNPIRNALEVEFTSTSNNTSGIGINTIVDNDNRIAFNVNNTQRGDVFAVYGNGNILITSQDNTETPIRVTSNFYNDDIFRLTGEGAVYATSVHVRAVYDFPDYVFDEAYDLMGLDSLKQYISLNNHLPNIPSAEEVKEKGMDLGEMNRLLVEKIEELTLYILQLEERLVIVETQP